MFCYWLTNLRAHQHKFMLFTVWLFIQNTFLSHILLLNQNRRKKKTSRKSFVEQHEWKLATKMHIHYRTSRMFVNNWIYSPLSFVARALHIRNWLTYIYIYMLSSHRLQCFLFCIQRVVRVLSIIHYTLAAYTMRYCF